jgi:hypothetical protein
MVLELKLLSLNIHYKKKKKKKAFMDGFFPDCFQNLQMVFLKPSGKNLLWIV